MSSRRIVALALAAAAAAGCGSARIVETTARGGSLVLHGDRYQATIDADEKMTAHCGGSYTVMSEGDEPAVTGKAGTRVRFVCGRVPGHPYSQYDPSDVSVTGVPNASSIGLE